MAGSDHFVGEVALFPYNFTPKDWAPCNGQLLSIMQNTALFSLLGTTYGGDGRSSFALPNLNGRAALGAGQGPGLDRHDDGEMGGQAEVAVLHSQMPNHSHSTRAVPGSATTGDPVGAVPATGGVKLRNAEPTLHDVLEPVGADQPHNNMQPSLALQYCIAIQGIFPPRP